MESKRSCYLGQVGNPTQEQRELKHTDSISRSVFHTATNDYEGKRQGNRVVSLGEKPFYNPASKSRREALAGL